MIHNERDTPFWPALAAHMEFFLETESHGLTQNLHSNKILK